ncbi:hypothetical protein JB92DRAFT_2993091 [Gautieria morchelliformis]|nr:hypothetical protein JB92DRAFT_2993091 [Gautieria morchelliformis]
MWKGVVSTLTKVLVTFAYMPRSAILPALALMLVMEVAVTVGEVVGDMGTLVHRAKLVTHAEVVCDVQSKIEHQLTMTSGPSEPGLCPRVEMLQLFSDRTYQQR